MINSIKKISIAFASNICSKMAFSVSASACTWGLYQPEEPKSLRK